MATRRDRRSGAPPSPGAGPGEPTAPWEAARLAALRQFNVLDTLPESAFDDLTALAAELCATPMALVSLVDEHRQWFKARLGLEVCETSRESSFCAHALGGPELLVVPDAALDPRFRDNPLVIGDPFIRFYAGAPLVLEDGLVLGTLCVLDTVPRELSAQQRSHLGVLARQVVSQLQLRRHADALAGEVAARVLAETALVSNQRLFAGVLSHTDVVVYAKDLDGRFILANQALRELLGQDKQVLGHNDHDLFPASSADQFRQHDLRIVATGVSETFNEELLHPDGTVHGYQSTKFPLLDDGGQVYAVAAVSTDITELTEERDAHAQAERRWQALVEHSPTGVAVIDSDGRFAYANAQATNIYGLLQADQLLGRLAMAFVPSGSEPETAVLLATLTAGSAPLLGHRWSIRQPGGAVIAVEVNAAPVTYRGRPALQVELRDITTQAAAEAALRASEARYRTLVTHAAVGVIEALADGTIATVNPALCVMLGYTVDELLGRPVALITQPSERERQGNEIAALSAGADGYVSDRTYLRKDGTTLPVLVSVGVIRTSDGTMHRLVGVVVDMSAQVAAEQALLEASLALALRQDFTEAVVEAVHAGVIACDHNGQVVVRNAAQRELTGVGSGEASISTGSFGQRVRLVRPDGSELSAEEYPLQQAFAGADLVNYPLQVCRTDGSVREVVVTAHQIRSAAGDVLGAVAATTDVTRERLVQAELRAGAAFHDAVLSASPDLIFVLDPRTNAMVWTSGSLTDLLGYSQDELADLGDAAIATLVHPDDVGRLLAVNVAVQDLADGEVLQIRYRLRHAAGDDRWLSRRVTPFARDQAGAVTQVLAIARDITDIVEVEQRLADAALRDPLTGLPNRTLLTDRLRLTLSRIDRTGQDLSVLFCDLDGFKQINDTVGHAAGDAVLNATAGRLLAALRAEDTLARIGGDEFVVLLEPDPRRTDEQGLPLDIRAHAIAVADRLRQAVRQPIAFGDRTHVVTASIGITFARGGAEPDDILRDADLAMYRAKSLGKDRCELFEGGPSVSALARSKGAAG